MKYSDIELIKDLVRQFGDDVTIVRSVPVRLADRYLKSTMEANVVFDGIPTKKTDALDTYFEYTRKEKTIKIVTEGHPLAMNYKRRARLRANIFYPEGYLEDLFEGESVVLYSVNQALILYKAILFLDRKACSDVMKRGYSKDNDYSVEVSGCKSNVWDYYRIDAARNIVRELLEEDEYFKMNLNRLRGYRLRYIASDDYWGEGKNYWGKLLTEFTCGAS